MNFNEYMNEQGLNELEKKVVFRKGVRKVVKKGRPGFKIVDGKEVKMSSEEMRKRKLGAKKTAIKNRSKKSQITRNRSKSMARRKSMS